MLCHQSEAHAVPESLPTHSMPNPQLIEDRDNELDRYDTAFTQLQTTIRERYVEGYAHVSCRVHTISRPTVCLVCCTVTCKSVS